jgi:hypothetical protein
MSKAIDQISLPNRLLSDGAVPVNPAAPKEAVLHHALAKQKKNNHQDNHKHELSHSERGWFWSCRSLCIQRSCHLICLCANVRGIFLNAQNSDDAYWYPLLRVLVENT